MPCWDHFLSTRAFALVFHWDSVPNFSFIGVPPQTPIAPRLLSRRLSLQAIRYALMRVSFAENPELPTSLCFVPLSAVRSEERIALR